jgi:hypothetical protein
VELEAGAVLRVARWAVVVGGAEKVTDVLDGHGADPVTEVGEVVVAGTVGGGGELCPEPGERVGEMREVVGEFSAGRRGRCGAGRTPKVDGESASRIGGAGRTRSGVVSGITSPCCGGDPGPFVSVGLAELLPAGGDGKELRGESHDGVSEGVTTESNRAAVGGVRAGPVGCAQSICVAHQSDALKIASVPAVHIQ